MDIKLKTLDSIARVQGGLIDGETTETKGTYQLPVLSPADESLVVTLAESDQDEVNRAVASAKSSFQSGIWSKASVTHRQDMLYKAAQLIRSNKQELAALDSLTTGLLYHSSTLRHTEAAANWFTYFAELIGTSGGALFEQKPNTKVAVSREPVGVAGLFTPWNIPLMGASLKLAAALATGNSCVLKPSEQSPLGAIRLAELLHEAGLPDGALHVVNGRGSVTGAALASHTDVDLVSFTGGENAGRIIATETAKRFAKTTMELGGKSANIIFADADLEQALEGSLSAIYANNGQACLAGSRILVHQSIADSFIADFIDRSKSLQIGQPFSTDANLGPLSSKQHMQKVLSYTEIVRQQGGEILTGGCEAEGFDKGYFVQPTAALAKNNRDKVCQEEIFGPFATFLIFDSDEEAVAMANDTRFGLVAYLWTESIRRALRTADAMRTGSVFINTSAIREPNAPFGGFGHSGMDREGGRWSLDFYTEPKATMMPF